MSNKKKSAGFLLVETTAFIGMIMLSYGLWLIKPEAMFTTIGVIFLAMSFFLHRGFNKTNHGG